MPARQGKNRGNPIQRSTSNAQRPTGRAGRFLLMLVLVIVIGVEWRNLQSAAKQDARPPSQAGCLTSRARERILHLFNLWKPIRKDLNNLIEQVEDIVGRNIVRQQGIEGEFVDPFGFFGKTTL